MAPTLQEEFSLELIGSERKRVQLHLLALALTLLITGLFYWSAEKPLFATRPLTYPLLIGACWCLPLTKGDCSST